MYDRLQVPFCYLWNFDFSNFRLSLAKKLFDTETSNLQVKFNFTVDFYNWYFYHDHYLILRLTRVAYAKLW